MTNSTCSADTCDLPVFVKKRGLCRSHYNRFMCAGNTLMEPVEKLCLHCGSDNPPQKPNGPAPKYCSAECKRLAAYARHIISGRYAEVQAERRAAFVPKAPSAIACDWCAELFTSKYDNARFCSSICNNRHLDANNPKRCTEAECARGVRAKGLCAMHWRRQARADGREANPVWDERRKAHYHKRRARKVTTQVEDLEPRDIYERDIWLCGLCSTAVDPDVAWPDPMSPSLDHIMPLSKGGTHTYENVQLAHLTCNVSKGNRIAA